MSTFTLTINLDNDEAAIHPIMAVRSYLASVADDVNDHGLANRSVWDGNGNKIGSYAFDHGAEDRAQSVAEFSDDDIPTEYA